MKSSQMRDIYGKTLLELFEKDETLVALDADLSSSIGTAELFKKYTDRAINVGVSEQNMIGVAAGLSILGLKPYIHTFAPFTTRRALDQIFMSLAYSNNTAHILGSDPGLWAQYNGGTHTTFEDIAIFKALANVTITAPSDPRSFEWVLRNYQANGGVYYTRAARGEFNYLYPKEHKFELGKSYTLKAGKDVAIFGVGTMVHEVLEAKELLEANDISAEVIDVFSIKPFDSEKVQAVLSKHDKLVVVENHNINGGVNELVAKEIVKAKKIVDFEVIAILDEFGEVGSADYLKERFGLDAKSISQRVLKMFGK